MTRFMTPVRKPSLTSADLFARHGISPVRRLGQNFLIDLNIHDLIVDSAAGGSGRRDSRSRVWHRGLDLAHGSPGRDRAGRRHRPDDGEARRRGGRRVCLTCVCSIATLSPTRIGSIPRCSKPCRAHWRRDSGRTLKLVANLPYAYRDAPDRQPAGARRALSVARWSSPSRKSLPTASVQRRRLPPMEPSRS